MNTIELNRILRMISEQYPSFRANIIYPPTPAHGDETGTTDYGILLVPLTWRANVTQAILLGSRHIYISSPWSLRRQRERSSLLKKKISKKQKSVSTE